MGHLEGMCSLFHTPIKERVITVKAGFIIDV